MSGVAWSVAQALLLRLRAGLGGRRRVGDAGPKMLESAHVHIREIARVRQMGLARGLHVGWVDRGMKGADGCVAGTYGQRLTMLAMTTVQLEHPDNGCPTLTSRVFAG